MNVPTTAVRRALSWGLATGLSLLAVPALWLIQDRVRVYTVYDAAAYGDLWPRRGGFFVHAAGGLIALCVGVGQLWLGSTGRTGALHRILGRAYLIGIGLGSAGGFYLVLTLQRTYFAHAAGLFMLCSAWVLTSSMAYLAIRRGAVEQHREWMIRSYAVTFAFVTLRLLGRLLGHWHFASEADIDTALAWGSWSVPLLLIEPMLQLRKSIPATALAGSFLSRESDSDR
jgi:uncharacterized membrane protein